MPAERETFTDLVASACRLEEAFKKNELFSEEAGETRRDTHPGLEFTKLLSTVFAAGNGYVRLEDARLRDESAELCCGDDTLVEQEQLRCNCDAGKEYPSAIEEAQSLDPDWNGRRAHFAQSWNSAPVFFFVSTTEELQGDVP